MNKKSNIPFTVVRLQGKRTEQLNVRVTKSAIRAMMLLLKNKRLQVAYGGIISQADIIESSLVNLIVDLMATSKGVPYPLDKGKVATQAKKIRKKKK